MKKLLILLPSLLLAFSACKDKDDKEDKDVLLAQSLAGTYNYTRVGKLQIGEGERLQAITTVGIATIIYGQDGNNAFQMRLTNDSKDTTTFIGTCNGGDIKFMYYTDHYSSGKEFSAQFDVHSEEVIVDNLSIFIKESYTGMATIPGIGLPCKGNGRLCLHRQ